MEAATFAIVAKKRQVLRTIRSILEVVMLFSGIAVSLFPIILNRNKYVARVLGIGLKVDACI